MNPTGSRRTWSARAFEVEIAAHLQTMFRFAASLSSLNDAEDLVQDALARAWVKRDQFDPARGSFQSWLLAIVADQARGRWRRRSQPLWTFIDVAAVVDADSGDAAADLQRAVAALPPRQRAAIVLHHWIDLPVVDVAELMSCSPGTVKSTLHDARQNLSRALGESYARD